MILGGSAVVAIVLRTPECESLLARMRDAPRPGIGADFPQTDCELA